MHNIQLICLCFYKYIFYIDFDNTTGFPVSQVDLVLNIHLLLL